MNHPAFGLIGVFLILFIAWIFSENKKAIRPRTVIVCFALQIAIAVLVLYVPFGQKLLTGMSDKVTTLLSYADAGIGFIFGDLANTEKVGFVFLVKVLPVVIFFAALMEVLYHLRVMQFVVRYGGKGVRWLTGTRPVESLNVIANVFVGQTEAPLSLKPYLPSISRAELFTIMVSGMASIAGTVLAGYIQLGIRPEYLRVQKDGRIKGTVTHVERLGGDTNLLVSTAEQEHLTVRIFGQDDTQVGECIQLDFDDQQSFAFDEHRQRIPA